MRAEPKPKPLCPCGNNAVAKGLCDTHRRQQREGRPLTFKWDWSGITGIWLCHLCTDRGGPYFSLDETKAERELHVEEKHRGYQAVTVDHRFKHAA